MLQVIHGTPRSLKVDVADLYNQNTHGKTSEDVTFLVCGPKPILGEQVSVYE
jgi:hypothetical protein